MIDEGEKGWCSHFPQEFRENKKKAYGKEGNGNSKTKGFLSPQMSVFE